jgi:hypothetical protein
MVRGGLLSQLLLQLLAAATTQRAVVAAAAVCVAAAVAAILLLFPSESSDRFLYLSLLLCFCVCSLQNEGLAENILQQPVLAAAGDDTVTGSPSEEEAMHDLAQVGFRVEEGGVLM